MPYKSAAQRGYFHANRAKLEAQGVNVAEWDKASKGKKLPKKVKASGGAVALNIARRAKAEGGSVLPSKKRRVEQGRAKHLERVLDADNNYLYGVGKLGAAMRGMDWVPPTTHFDDQPTGEEKSRRLLYPQTSDLKRFETEIEKNMVKPDSYWARSHDDLWEGDFARGLLRSQQPRSLAGGGGVPWVDQGNDQPAVQAATEAAAARTRQGIAPRPDYGSGLGTVGKAVGNDLYRQATIPARMWEEAKRPYMQEGTQTDADPTGAEVAGEGIGTLALGMLGPRPMNSLGSAGKPMPKPPVKSPIKTMDDAEYNQLLKQIEQDKFEKEMLELNPKPKPEVNPHEKEIYTLDSHDTFGPFKNEEEAHSFAKQKGLSTYGVKATKEAEDANFAKWDTKNDMITSLSDGKKIPYLDSYEKKYVESLVKNLGNLKPYELPEFLVTNFSKNSKLKDVFAQAAEKAFGGHEGSVWDKLLKPQFDKYFGNTKAIDDGAGGVLHVPITDHAAVLKQAFGSKVDDFFKKIGGMSGPETAKLINSYPHKGLQQAILAKIEEKWPDVHSFIVAELNDLPKPWASSEPVSLAKNAGEFGKDIGDEHKSFVQAMWGDKGDNGFYGFDPNELPKGKVPFSPPPIAEEKGFPVASAHGTPSKEEYSKFLLPEREIGVHFGSPRATGRFNRPTYYKEDKEGKPLTKLRTYPVVLSAKNPIRLHDLGIWTPNRMESGLVAAGLPKEEVQRARYGDKYKQPYDSSAPKVSQEEQIVNLRKYLESKGYDSISYINEVEDSGHLSHIMFRAAPDDPQHAIGVKVPWAKFEKLHDPNVTTGIAGAGVTGAVASRHHKKDEEKAMGGSVIDRTARKYARGGIPDAQNVEDWQERRALHKSVGSGMLKSPIPGRTDKLPIGVPSGSYVIPADIVSGLGQGNSDAGNVILGKMFNSGPFGMKPLKGGKAGAKGRLRTGKVPKAGKISFAEGGATEEVPIIAAGGEYILTPDQVSEAGHGDVNAGHEVLDAFVKHARQQIVNTMKKLPGPSK